MAWAQNPCLAPNSCIGQPGEPANGTLVQCDDFESYSVSTQIGIAQQDSSGYWRGWAAWHDALLKFGPPALSTKTLSMEDGSKIIYKLGNLSSGKYQLSWDMYINPGKRAHFALHYKLPNQSGQFFDDAVQILFVEGGSGQITFQNLPPKGFQYPQFTKFRIDIIVDINNDLAEFKINNNLIHSWAYSQGLNSGNPLLLAGIDFLGSTNTPNMDFCIDNMCIWQLPSVISGPTICDIGGPFIHRDIYLIDTLNGNDSYTFSTDRWILAPYTLKTDTCVQNTYGANVSDSLYAHIFVFYNDTIKDIEVETSVNDPDFEGFIFSCDCSNLPCVPICLESSEDGLLQISNADVGTYFIVFTSIQKTDFSFRIKPSPPCTDAAVFLSTSNITVPFATSILDSVNYANCNEEAGAYNGPEAIFVINGGFYDSTIVFFKPWSDDTAMLTGQNVFLTSSTPFDLFLFDYVCGERCIQSMHSTPVENNTEYYAVLEIPTTPGLYYLVAENIGSPGDSITISPPGGCSNLNRDGNTSNRTDVCVGGVYFALSVDSALCPLDGNAIYEINFADDAYTENGFFHFFYTKNQST